MKKHYIYLAIGYDANKLCNKLSLLCPLLRMQFYIGVRTGQLPDDSYKTSSKNKQWKYLAKVPLAILETREQAAKAEIEALKYMKANNLWNIFANKAIALDFCNIGKSGWNKGLATSAETKAKQSAGNKGRKPWNIGLATPLNTRRKQSKAMRNRPPNNKGKKRSIDARTKTAETNLQKTHNRLNKYGPIAVERKEDGAILLADAQCMLDFCRYTDIYLGNLEKVFKGQLFSVNGWRIIDKIA